jgi:hypothetical protein
MYACSKTLLRSRAIVHPMFLQDLIETGHYLRHTSLLLNAAKRSKKIFDVQNRLTGKTARQLFKEAQRFDVPGIDFMKLHFG